jgi:hypothetical protein
MIHMIVNQPPLRFADRLLDRMQLLSEINATAAFIEHLDDSPHVPLGTLEALDDVGMRLMNVCLCHSRTVSYPGGYAKPGKLSPVSRAHPASINGCAAARAHERAAKRGCAVGDATFRA